MAGNLKRLLRPKAIAVVGGGAESRYLLENCARVGFSGPVWHVHPSRAEYSSVNELPEPPDAAFIGVNRQATIGIIEDLAAMGAGGAVAYASGYSEAEAEDGDGAGLQAQLLDAAEGMVLIGPNCYGFLNYLDGAALWPDQQGGRRCERGVAIITQSSNIAINLTMQRRGLPVAYIVTVGNQAQTGVAEIGAELLEDDRVTALGLHLEGVGDIRRFEAMAARALELGTPVVVLKTGRSEASRAAAMSHTASITGSTAGAEAFFNRLGVAQVSSLPQLLETLKLLHVSGPLESNRIASMSCSGGEAGLMADGVLDGNLEFPPLRDPQRSALRAALGPRVALANPLDYHTYIWRDVEAMTAVFTAMAQGDVALGAVVADFPRSDRCSDADWEPVIAATSEAMRIAGKPMAIVASLPETMPEATAERLAGLGIAPMNGIDEALEAFEAAAWLGCGRMVPAPALASGTPRNVRLLSEADSKAALAGHGVEIPSSVRIASSGEVAAAAGRLEFPLVLKGEGVAHKTEAGAVALNLRCVEEVKLAAQRMGNGGFLLEEMVSGGVAELLVGVTCDPAHGYVLTLAAGGVLTEIIRDSASFLLPVADREIREGLSGLRIAPLLEGFRGSPAADIEAVIRAVSAVASYVSANAGRIEEVEINPLICTPNRAVAVDVMIGIGEVE